MRRAILRMAPAFALLFSVAGLLGPSIARADSKGSVNFILGGKSLDSDWEPNEDQGEFGAEVTWGPADWPIAFATDILASSAGADLLGIEINDQSSELAFGVRKIWEAGRARPYLGGGVAKLDAQRERGNVTEDDTTLGGWIGGGIFWRLGSRFNIGIAARVSRGQVTIGGEDKEAGGSHAGLILGWGWPAGK
jgi:hypothetical protein